MPKPKDPNRLDPGDIADSLLDVIGPIGGLRYKRMFGGVGLYHEDKIFGIVHGEGDIYFKVNDATRDAYVAAQSKVFGKQYYSVPADVLEDDKTLIEWAETAISISK